MTQIIQTNFEEQKQYEVSERTFEVTTGDYGYCYTLSADVYEKLEKCDYNNPDRECETVETWYCNGTPVLRATFNCEVEGPCKPDKVEILDSKEFYNILMTCGSLANLFDHQIK